jgi:hypothetical protein
MDIKTFKVALVVDYSQNLEQMIKIGKYKWISKSITENNFPLAIELSGKKVVVSAKLFNFSKEISSEEVIYEMKKEGCHPATFAELLALGKIIPELQEQFPIVSLGFIWRSNYNFCRVTCLGSGGYGRELYVLWFDKIWTTNYHFLAICD